MTSNDEREALIEKAAKEIFEAGIQKWMPQWVDLTDEQRTPHRERARAALSVFQQSLSTTKTVNILREDWERFKRWEQSTPAPAGKREALAAVIREFDYLSPSKKVRQSGEIADRILAWMRERGYRRDHFRGVSKMVPAENPEQIGGPGCGCTTRLVRNADWSSRELDLVPCEKHSGHPEPTLNPAERRNDEFTRLDNYTEHPEPTEPSSAPNTTENGADPMKTPGQGTAPTEPRDAAGRAE